MKRSHQSENDNPKVKAPRNFKTLPCKFFPAGRCQKGDGCPYIHFDAAGHPLPSPPPSPFAEVAEQQNGPQQLNKQQGLPKQQLQQQQAYYVGGNPQYMIQQQFYPNGVQTPGVQIVPNPHYIPHTTPNFTPVNSHPSSPSYESMAMFQSGFQRAQASLTPPGSTSPTPGSPGFNAQNGYHGNHYNGQIVNAQSGYAYPPLPPSLPASPGSYYPDGQQTVQVQYVMPQAQSHAATVQHLQQQQHYVQQHHQQPPQPYPQPQGSTPQLFIVPSLPDAAGFALSQAQMPYKYKTEQCKYFGMGKCKKDAGCPYRHDFAPSPPPARPLPYKVKDCRFFLQGTCTKGDSCTYLHPKGAGGSLPEGAAGPAPNDAEAKGSGSPVAAAGGKDADGDAELSDSAAASTSHKPLAQPSRPISV